MKKLEPYRKLLTMGEDALNAVLADVRVEKAKAKAILEIATMNERIASQEASIQEQCSSKEINFDAIIEAHDDLGLMERRKKQFEKIIAEMFPA